MKKGFIRFLAKQSLQRIPIPIFKSRKINQAILAEEDRLLKARTFVPAAERKAPLPDED